eukprot:7387198-Prymnesium_polylepis.6
MILTVVHIGVHTQVVGEVGAPECDGVLDLAEVAIDKVACGLTEEARRVAVGGHGVDHGRGPPLRRSAVFRRVLTDDRARRVVFIGRQVLKHA